MTFTFLDSATGHGELSLALLEDEDTKRVLELIDGVWQAPTMPEVPDELHLRARKKSPRRRDVILKDAGIETDWTGRMRAYRWDEVGEVLLVRTTHFQQGFETLRLTLPDTLIELRVTRQKGERHPNWKGAEAREIVVFLMNHVAEKKLHVVALSGPARSLADFDARTVPIEKQERKSRVVDWLTLGGFAALGVWFAVKASSVSNPLEDLPVALKILVVLTLLLVAAGPVLILGLVLTTRRAWRK
mgnify:CR=1 FL=1